MFYPPTWLAGLVAGAALLVQVVLAPVGLLHAKCAVFAAGPAPSYSIVWRAILAVVFICALATVAWFGSMLAARRKVKSPPPRDGGRLSDFEKLERWVAVDEPITTVSEDMFGHGEIARRLADLIAGPTAPTVGLVAPLGAGKTSIRNLVSERLAAPPRWGAGTQLVTVGLWPFNTSDAAISGVLSAVTRALAEHVNTVPLRGLEQDYLEAIEGVAGSFGKLIRVTKPASPKAVLGRYDSVATAIGLKIVLWVEDFERFAGLHRGVQEPEYIRLAPLRALLNELAELSAFQVVLASSAADYRFDLEKLARYVINVPPPRVVALGRLVALFREGCAARYPFLDAAPASERERLWPDEEKLGWMAAWSPMSLQRAIASLCDNPRQFKQALRTFLESWRKLAGEVDIDEVLMLSALAVASPKIVELLNTHINRLRAGAPFEKEKEKPTRFAEEVAEELKRSEAADATAVRFVLSELFPEWENGQERRSTPKRPQGFAQTHTDYWMRYWSQMPPEPRASDQRMLQLIDDWRERKPGELAHVMTSGEHPDSLEALLASRLEGADLLRLLEDVVAAEFKTLRHNWGDGSTKGDPPALVSVWRMMLRAKPESQGLLEMLRGQFRAILPTNVALAWELIYFFGASENQVEPVLDPTQVTTLGQEFRKEIGAVFKGRPGELIDALRGADMHVFYWSLWGLENVRAHRTQGVPESWTELVDTVVEAVNRAPEVMIPQILPFIVKVHQGIDWALTRRRPQQFTKYEWDRDSTERLFGVSRFQEMMRAHAGLQLGSEDAQAMLAAVYSGLAAVRS